MGTTKLSRISVLETALAGLVARIAVLEKMLGDPPADAVEAGCDGDRRLSKKRLAGRWGTSTRTIDRERKRKRNSDKPEFPAPDIVNGQCMWWLSRIREYERATQVGGTAPDRSEYLGRSKASTEAAAKDVAGKEAAASFGSFPDLPL
jgi:hypothetical protein